MRAADTPAAAGAMGRDEFRGMIRSVLAELQAEQAAILLTRQEAMKLLGLSKSSWHRLASADRLPKPVRLEGAGLRWKRSELERWAERLKPARRATVAAE